jgi:hypothetical protein
MSDSMDNRANNLSSLRADVAETTNVLKVTVDKLVDRGDRLDTLNARAEDLSSSSYHFHGSARRVQRRMKWQNYRITIFISKFSFFFYFFDKLKRKNNYFYLFLVAVVVIVIGLIILVALHPWKK